MSPCCVRSRVHIMAQKCEELYNRTTGFEVALNCTTACCRTCLSITWVGVAGWKLWVVISSLHGHGLPAPPLPHPLPPLWVWLCSTSVQCSHAGLRCINHWTTDTELCNRLAPFTIVAVAAVQTGSRESLVTMPTTPATRLLSTQMGLLPFMHSWLCWLQ